MKQETIEIRIEALTNAAEMIRSHVETGLTPDDLGGINVNDYQKQCKYVQRLLEKKAHQLSRLLTNKN